MTYQQDPQYPPPSSTPGQPPYGQPDPAYGQQSYDQHGYGQQPYGHPGAGYSPGYGAAPEGSSDDRTWSTIAHVGSFLAAWIALGLLCPLLVLLAKPDRPFVRRHAYESLNFQLNAAALYLLFVVIGGITLGIGFVVLAIPAVAYVCFYTVCVIRASMAANRGEDYRYPLTVRVLNP